MRRRLLNLRVVGDLRQREIALSSVARACAEATRVGVGACADQQAIGDQLLSAVGEAFNNIVLHGYRGQVAGPVEIEVTADREHVVVEMRDQGLSYDPRYAPIPQLESLPEGGLGAFIIRSFVDTVDYTPGSPNVLTLTKRLR